ncbi:MAG: TIGR01440 family protein [Firmicutes bacterium]|nr:TIGR01440 family protein [Bacillota bacterium]
MESTLSKILQGLIKIAELQKGNILVIGCSTSEITGEKIGSASNLEIAQIIISGLLAFVREKELYLAVQCCEHLNRALVVEKECVERYNLEPVSVLPYLEAGGALATVAMEHFDEPVIVEAIAAHAGLDIGDTLIGMHLKKVAVPLRLPIKKIGKANLTLARTRPKFIGGERAKYPHDIGK